MQRMLAIAISLAALSGVAAADDSGTPTNLPVETSTVIIPADRIPDVVPAPSEAKDQMIQQLACEVCGCSSLTGPVQSLYTPGFVVGVNEQFSHLGTAMEGTDHISNSAGQSLNSSTTQLLLGYNFSETVGLQLSLPFIDRTFTRVYNHAIQSGSESGLGDSTLSVRYTPISNFSTDDAFVWNLQAGLKMPTGSADRLYEEVLEHGPGAHHHDESHGGLPEGLVGGHDTTLGSGSVDGVVGTSLFYRNKSFFVNAGVQYFIRTRGSYDYKFGNSLFWNVSPGFFVVRDDETLVGLQLNLSGDSKNTDDLAGNFIDHTGSNYVMLGPQVFASTAGGFSATAGLDLPVYRSTTGPTLVPDYRLRLQLNWKL